MWLATRKSTLLTGLYRYKTIQCGGGQGGRPQLSWLEPVDESCQELLRMGKGPAWRLARRNPRVWRRRVGDATRSPAYAAFD